MCYMRRMDNKRSIALHVRVTPETHQNLVRLAEADKRPLASMMAVLIDEALERRSILEPIGKRREAAVHTTG